jgi:hypothetical protein
MLSYLSVKLRELASFNRSQQKAITYKRAINYFPSQSLSPKAKNPLTISQRMPLLPQLINIEAQKLSGCVKTESSRFKSRSAMLLYKGQVIASVYGSKKNPEQLFGPEAYTMILNELGSVHVDLSSYILQDEVVLSAASMFHGQVFNPKESGSAVAALSECLDYIDSFAGPASIAVVDKDGNAVCLLYVFGHGVLGINSLNSLVSEKDINSLWQYLKKHPESQIMANSIIADNVSVLGLTFSLMGHNRKHSAPASVCDPEVANLVAKYSFKPTDRAPGVQVDRFISTTDKIAKKPKVALGYATSYEIHHTY